MDNGKYYIECINSGKNGEDDLAKQLQMPFQSPFECGAFLETLNEGIICPVQRGRSRDDAVNNRPASLTSHFSKITDRRVSFLEENSLLTNTQHGFCPE